jgi:signal transduction histidine kinase
MIAADLESGDYAVNLSQVNVTSLMEGSIDTFLPLISRKRLQIKWAGETEDPIMFVSDAEKFAILFANLLDNAIKFSNHDGEILIDAALHDGKLSISIRDFGIGIQKEDQKRIFDRFFQLDSGSTRVHPGHGIGLSIVSALVELLKGNLQLESAACKGTGVTVLFPIPELPENIDIFADEGNLLIFGQDNGK